MAGHKDPPEHSQFKPGQSGNPGGKTSAQRKLEVENAEKATRIHAALLDKVIALIEAGETPALEANLLKLAKDVQDRGLGAPAQTLDLTHRLADLPDEDLDALIASKLGE